MEFEYLPPDIKRSILHESSRYGLSSQYAEDEQLQNLKMLRCLEPPSHFEIMTGINNGVSFLVIDHNMYERRLTSISSDPDVLPWKVYTSGTTYEIDYVSAKSREVEAGDDHVTYSVVIHFCGDKVGKHPMVKKYDSILLTPQSVHAIVSSRPDLCLKHAKEAVNNYILQVYNSSLDKTLIDMWLLASLWEQGEDLDILIGNRVVYGRTDVRRYNRSDVTNKREQLLNALLM